MKYLSVIALLLLVAAGCKKNNCVQCAKQVKTGTQTTTVTTDYSLVYEKFCGLQADSAMSTDSTTFAIFQNEQDFVPYSCFYQN